MPESPWPPTRFGACTISLKNITQETATYMPKILPCLLKEFRFEATIGSGIIDLDGIKLCDMRLVDAANEVGGEVRPLVIPIPPVSEARVDL
jgi:hypothetical protein